VRLKRTVSGFLCVASVVLFTSLGCEKGQNTETPEAEESAQSEDQIQVVQPVQAVCILDELAFWAGPSTKKGYKHYNLKKGEIVTWLGKQEAEQDDDRKRKYFNIRLSDGSEGWALAAYIVPNAEPAAVVDKTSIYSKNSLISKTDSSFEAVDIVALVEIQDDWLKVVGSYKESPVWIKPGSITKAEVDIAVANQTQRALASEDQETRRQKLIGILEEEAFTDSIFIALVQSQLQEILDKERDEKESPDEREEAAEEEIKDETDRESGGSGAGSE
jgi:hypothetical protein